MHHDGHDVLAARQQRASDCKRDEAYHKGEYVARHVLRDGACDKRVDRRGEHVAQCEAALPQAEQEHRRQAEALGERPQVGPRHRGHDGEVDEQQLVVKRQARGDGEGQRRHENGDDGHHGAECPAERLVAPSNRRAHRKHQRPSHKHEEDAQKRPHKARLRLHDDACVHDDVALNQAHAEHCGKHRPRKRPTLDLEFGEIGVLAHVGIGKAVGHARAQKHQVGELQKRDDGMQPRRLGQEGSQQNIGADAADHADHGVQRDVAQAQAPEADAPQKDEQAHAQAVADAADERKHRLHRGVNVAAGDAAEGAGNEKRHRDDNGLVGAENRMHALVDKGTAEQHGGRRRAEGVTHEAGHGTRALIASKHHVEGKQKHEAQAQRLAVHLSQVALVCRLHVKAHLWYAQCHPIPPSRGICRLARPA